MYYFYFALVYILFSFILGPIIFLFVRGKNKFRRARRIKIFWAKWMMFFVGIKYETKMESTIPFNQPYIICPNHKSYLDIVLMYLIIPHDFAFIGKSELLKWPVVRIFFKRGVDIPVYRDSIARAAKCLSQAADELNKGRSVVVFPEGGWDDNPGMRRFKNGAFQLAIDNGVRILPVTFKNNYSLFTDHTDFSGNAKPGLAKIVMHKPIETESLSRKELVSLRDETFNIIKNELDCEN